MVHVFLKQVYNGQLLLQTHFLSDTGPFMAGQEESTQFRHTYCLSPDMVEHRTDWKLHVVPNIKTHFLSITGPCQRPDSVMKT